MNRHLISMFMLAAATALLGCGDDDASVACGDGTENVDGRCVPTDGTTCGEGTVRNAETGECEAGSSTVCGAGTTLDPASGECLPDGGTECGPGTTLQGDECLPDPLDTTAPGEVTGFTATATMTGVDLAWTNPTDEDFTGVVIVRTTYERGTHSPNTGTTYAASELLGPSEEVIYVDAGTSFSDLSAPPGLVYYAVFAHDAANNYGTGVVADAVVAVPTQSLQLSIEVGPAPVVTVVQSPSAYTVSATANLDGTDLNVAVSATSDVGRVVFAPKLVLDATNEGTLGEDGTVDGDGYVEMTPTALDFGATATRSFIVSNVDGSPATVVLDMHIEESPLMLTNEGVLTTDALHLYDTGARAELASIPCSDMPIALGTRGGCGVRFGALSDNGKYGYFSSRNSATVFKLDTTSWAPALVVELSDQKGHVDGVTLTDDGETLYAVLNLGNHGTRDTMPAYGGRADSEVVLVRLDANTLEETARLTLRAPMTGIDMLAGRAPTLTDDETIAIIPVTGGGTVHFVDLTTMTEIDTDSATAGVQPIDTSAVSINPRSVMLSQDAMTAYIGYAGGDRAGNNTAAAVSTISLTDYTLGALSMGGGITEASIPTMGRAPDGSLWILRVNISGGDGIELSVFDADGTNESRVALSMGGATGIGFSPDGATAYINDSSSLTLVDVASRTQLDFDGDASNGLTFGTIGGGGQHGVLITPF